MYVGAVDLIVAKGFWYVLLSDLAINLVNNYRPIKSDRIFVIVLELSNKKYQLL